MLLVMICMGGTALVLAARRSKNRLVVVAADLWLVFCCAAGAAGLLITRTLFQGKLLAAAESFSVIEQEHYLWFLMKFDRFMVGSIIAVGLVLWLLLWALKQKNRLDWVWQNFFITCYSSMVLLLACTVWYGISTVNKMFDVAAWIGIFALSECGVLHLPLALRLWMLQKDNK